MKGFVASMLAAVPDLAAMPLARPVHLFITFDEETDDDRRPPADRRPWAGPRRAPPLCVVGEPSLMQPIVGHKGRLAARAVVRGSAGHSADPARGVNAIHAASRRSPGSRRRPTGRQAEGPFAEGFEPPLHHEPGRDHRRRHGTQHRPRTLRIHRGVAADPRRDPREALARLEAYVAAASGRRCGPSTPAAASPSRCRTGFPACPCRRTTRWPPRSATPRARTARAMSATRPRAACTRRPTSPPSSAAPARSTRRTGRMSGSRQAQLDACDAFIRQLATGDMTDRPRRAARLGTGHNAPRARAAQPTTRPARFRGGDRAAEARRRLARGQLRRAGLRQPCRRPARPARGPHQPDPWQRAGRRDRARASAGGGDKAAAGAAHHRLRQPRRVRPVRPGAADRVAASSTRTSTGSGTIPCWTARASAWSWPAPAQCAP